ncbi:MAG: hypothetical protein L0K47_10610 [Acidipropionibacterium jensenii]|uniref:hypothetical protein n=1 Tax=Acidipropionibacterium jensenii TaxID=1749 RepID=UPI002649F1F0|nr:hypothetical protein [Acidipropionibacterium jensenii]MDN5962355.1 hypothetical protein [Propionibacterium sp.]MDN6481244.1 hypothetical protein [Acidipropionibacterium jensenii]MDN6513740.1 hypothetical protein [Acidipropionibacterium jensenii]MDN6593021.1 hypothetical protein [Acidipropionibacterium jensenii]MDN6660223.1 hypothetical protein [Acidipropionibacterium jensenii]
MSNNEPCQQAPIRLECRHDHDGWTVLARDEDPEVTTTAKSRPTAVRRAQRIVGDHRHIPAVDLTFVVTIDAPPGVRQTLAETDTQIAQARTKMASVLRGLLDDGWALSDVAELANRSNSWVKQFLKETES